MILDITKHHWRNKLCIAKHYQRHHRNDIKGDISEIISLHSMPGDFTEILNIE